MAKKKAAKASAARVSKRTGTSTVKAKRTPAARIQAKSGQSKRLRNKAKKGVKPKLLNAIDLLKKDHREVDVLFEQIEHVSHKGHQRHRHKLFSKLMEELTRHADAEEQVLYPRLQRIETLREHAFEAVEEHRLVRHMLVDLESAPSYWGEKWNAKLAVLKEMIQHHVEEEEGAIFRKLKQEVSERELLELGRRLEAAKQTVRQPEFDAEVAALGERDEGAVDRDDEDAPTPAQRREDFHRTSL